MRELVALGLPGRPELQCAHSTVDSRLGQAPAVALREAAHSPLRLFAHLGDGDADGHAVLTRLSQEPHTYISHRGWSITVLDKDVTIAFLCVLRVDPRAQAAFSPFSS